MLMSFDERLYMVSSKGIMYYDQTFVIGSSITNIDFDRVKDYCDIIGYGKSPESFIMETRGFAPNNKGEVTVADILLFSKDVNYYFPRAQIRFVRYDGTIEKYGTEMNVIKDRIFNGPLLDQLNAAINYVREQIKERTFLEERGIFTTIPEYPETAWKELIVNAVCHREYAIKGTDIQIKMFDDKIVVDSPGNLPGNVRIDNIQHTHYSRNPMIAAYLKAYKFVKEFGEGMERMFKDMEEANLPKPTFKDEYFMMKATIRNSNVSQYDFKSKDVGQDVGQEIEIKLLIRKNNKVTKKQIASILGVSEKTIERQMQKMVDVKYIGSGYSGHWEIDD